MTQKTEDYLDEAYDRMKDAEADINEEKNKNE